MTSRSIASIIRVVLAAGVKFILTNYLNQDPLEQLFDHCRHKGGSNANPNIHEACHTMNTIRAVGMQAVANRLGNTAVCKKELDFTPVPRQSSVNPTK